MLVSITPLEFNLIGVNSVPLELVTLKDKSAGTLPVDTVPSISEIILAPPV